jgi:prevent-host-death family protein
MAKHRRPGRASRRVASSRSRTSNIAAAEFKATCLELMERVRETGVEYVVTKHGKPVAKLVPYKATRRKGFGSMKGTVLAYERPFDPIEGEYDIMRD